MLKPLHLRGTEKCDKIVISVKCIIMKKKKESKRKITIAISKELIELIQKEAIKEKTTNTAIYYKILEKYFENKDKISIDSMC